MLSYLHFCWSTNIILRGFDLWTAPPPSPRFGHPSAHDPSTLTPAVRPCYLHSLPRLGNAAWASPRISAGAWPWCWPQAAWAVRAGLTRIGPSAWQGWLGKPNKSASPVLPAMPSLPFHCGMSTPRAVVAASTADWAKANNSASATPRAHPSLLFGLDLWHSTASDSQHRSLGGLNRMGAAWALLPCPAYCVLRAGLARTLLSDSATRTGASFLIKPSAWPLGCPRPLQSAGRPQPAPHQDIGPLYPERVDDSDISP